MKLLFSIRKSKKTVKTKARQTKPTEGKTRTRRSIGWRMWHSRIKIRMKVVRIPTRTRRIRKETFRPSGNCLSDRRTNRTVAMDRVLIRPQIVPTPLQTMLTMPLVITAVPLRKAARNRNWILWMRYNSFHFTFSTYKNLIHFFCIFLLQMKVFLSFYGAKFSEFSVKQIC